MARLNRIEDVLFPVEEHPVFAIVKNSSGERRLAIPDKKAIVNCTTGRVLGVMSRSYRLVSNREALDFARQCCRAVFPETSPAEWIVESTSAPSTGGHCSIDLVHNSAKLDFSLVPAQNRPEMFGPFIRVNNSYNGLHALSFDIGFFRKVCKNGMIVPGTIIQFNFTHQQKDIEGLIKLDFKIAHERLKDFKKSFGDYLGALSNCKVGRAEFEPLLFGVLSLRKPKNALPDSRELVSWSDLQRYVRDMCSGYADELGENAYAVFNAITDFASHPPENRCVHRERHGFQRLAGAWLNGFIHECGKPDFKIKEYIDDIGKNEDNVNKPKDHANDTAINTSGRPLFR